MKLNFQFLIYSLCITFSSFSQVPGIKWQKLTGLPNAYDFVFHTQKINDKEHILTGLSTSYQTNQWVDDYYISKLDSMGNSVWKFNFKSNYYPDEAYYGLTNPLVDSFDNSIYIAGTIYFAPPVPYKNKILKFNSNGNLLWSKEIDIFKTVNSNLVKVGNYLYVILGGYELCKFDLDGNLISDYFIFSPFGNTYRNFRIKALPNNDLIITYENGNIFAMRIDNNFNTIWTNNYGSSGIDTNSDLIIDSNGNPVILGFVSNDDGDVTNYVLDKYGQKQGNTWVLNINANNGAIISQKCIGPETGSREIIMNNDGDFYITGIDVSPDNGTNKFGLLKLKKTGEIPWRKYFPSNSSYFPGHPTFQNRGMGLSLNSKNEIFMIGNVGEVNNMQISNKLLESWIVKFHDETKCTESETILTDVTLNKEYYTTNFIEGKSRVLNGINAGFYSEKKILLSTGFETSPNSVFKAEIKGCN